MQLERRLRALDSERARREPELLRVRSNLASLNAMAAVVQILINVLGNAHDAMAGTKSKRIDLWAVAGPNRVHLYVKDSGTGMTRDVARRAFDPFYTTKGDSGVGMGLYIAYNLARKMNCQLAIKRTMRGKGTEIELVLPRHVPEENTHHD